MSGGEDGYGIQVGDAAGLVLNDCFTVTPMDIIPWKMDLTISTSDGVPLVRLFENDEGMLDAEITDRSRLTEAAVQFADHMAALAGCRIEHVPLA